MNKYNVYETIIKVCLFFNNPLTLEVLGKCVNHYVTMSSLLICLFACFTFCFL